MISNERHWPSHLHPSPRKFDSGPRDVRPLSWVGTLASQQLQIERKRFLVALKENPAGRFLRVTELMGDRSNTIIIPASGLDEFSKLLGEMIKAAAELPPANPDPAAEIAPEMAETGDVNLAAAHAPASV
jgi:hypothetical protein